jgi:hypothetical protein
VASSIAGAQSKRGEIRELNRAMATITIDLLTTPVARSVPDLSYPVPLIYIYEYQLLTQPFRLPMSNRKSS